MDDTELDTLLRESAPPLTPVPGLAAHGERILGDARGKARRRWRGLTTGAVAAALVLGGGSLAAANNGLGNLFDFATNLAFATDDPTGEACYHGYEVVGAGLKDDDPMLVKAREILADIDPESLHIDPVDETSLRNSIEEARARGVDPSGLPGEGGIHAILLNNAISNEWANRLAKAGYGDRISELGLQGAYKPCEK